MNDPTNQFFSIVTFWYIYLISSQNPHYFVGYLVHSSWCLVYHQKWYTPKFLVETGSNLSISACSRDYFSYVEPTVILLINNILSFDIYMFIFSSLSALKLPYLILLWFLCLLASTYSFPWSYGFSFSLIYYSPVSSSLESRYGSTYGQK